ncbi:MAG: hypothetical protein D3916_15235 [Candidatus Electrothrix sp. MAN1_4]|nr:hypothetical protein [Candidatus Electrothrix sp. MAN1_4]
MIIGKLEPLNITLLTGLISIGTAIVSYIYLPTIGLGGDIGTTVSILLAIFVATTGFEIARLRDMDSIRREVGLKISSLEKQFRDTSLTQAFSSQGEAYNYILKSIKMAEEVYNTSLRTGEKTYSASYFHKEELLSSLARCFKDLMDRDGRWTDITTLNNISNTSARREVAEIMSSRSYRLIVLEDSVIPFTNFIIINFGAQKVPEVLYGWPFSEGSRVSRVFLSRDPQIVDYFRNQFSILEGVSPVDSY